MKRLIAAVMACASLSATAASEHDGVYMCTISVPAAAYSTQAFMSFHSKADGSAATIIAAPYQTAVAGYSIGTINGDQYTGNNEHGDPVTASPIGSMFIAHEEFYVNNVKFPATYTCLKIF